MSRGQLLAVSTGDSPAAWEAAGFRVERDPADPVPLVWLRSTAVRLGEGGPGLGGWALEGIDRDIDGLRRTSPAGTAPRGAAHPNGIVGIDHLVVATGDVDRTVSSLRAAGLELRRERTVADGPAARRQAFLWVGDVILEVVGPGSPDGSPAAFFGLALVADDLDTTAAHLGDLLGPPRPAVQPGRRIAGLRGAAVGVSVALAVMDAHRPS